MNTSRLDFEANCRGYTILYKGQRIGGGGILKNPICPKTRVKNLEHYSNRASLIIRDLKEGRGNTFLISAINDIDNLSLGYLDGEA